MRKSRGTEIPDDLRRAVLARDGGCVGPRIGMPGRCDGPIDLDHIRASGALGKKSRTTADNLVSLCRFTHHRLKTREGRTWRPRLIDAVELALGRSCPHVEPYPGCQGPCQGVPTDPYVIGLVR